MISTLYRQSIYVQLQNTASYRVVQAASESIEMNPSPQSNQGSPASSSSSLFGHSSSEEDKENETLNLALISGSTATDRVPSIDGLSVFPKLLPEDVACE